MNPLVTLVTPVWNAMPHLRAYLACVMAQTWRPLQFIAVDDGSADGSWEYLCRMRGELEAAGLELCLLRTAHGGAAAAVNAALPQVRGELFTWCDADDLLTPDSLEEKARALLACPQLGLVRSDGILWDVGSGRQRRIAAPADRRTQNIFDAVFRQQTYCFAGCYMLRTALLFACYPQRRIPLSPEGQNLQLLLPPASRSACGFVPDKLFRYCLRPGGHSSRPRTYTEQRARAENFARLRAALLPHCACDRAHYLLVNETLRQAAEQELRRAALACAREAMKR